MIIEKLREFISKLDKTELKIFYDELRKYFNIKNTNTTAINSIQKM